MNGPTPREIELYYFEFHEAAALLHCSDTALRRLLGLGRFREVRRAGKWYIPPPLDDLREVLRCRAAS